MAKTSMNKEFKCSVQNSDWIDFEINDLTDSLVISRSIPTDSEPVILITKDEAIELANAILKAYCIK